MYDTQTKVLDRDATTAAKRHIFGVRKGSTWVVGGEVPAGTIGAAICGALAMAHGEIRPGMKPPPDPCLDCLEIRDDIILKGMGLL